MSRVQQWLSAVCVIAFLLLPGLLGCAADPNRTHRGDVLDDQVTSERVKAELKRAGKGYKEVTVRAKNGEVTLSGTVNSREAHVRAEQIARGVPDVETVKNELHIRH